MMPPTDIQISVLGDIAWQEVLVPDGDKPNQYKRYTDWIGAPLIREMIQHALTDESSKTARHSPVSPALSLPSPSFRPDYAELAKDHLKPGSPTRNHAYATWDALLDECGQYSATLGAFPRRSRSDDKKDTVLRVAQDLRAVQALPSGDKKSIHRLLSKWAEQAGRRSEKPRLIIIYDRGIFLRDNVEPLRQVVRSLTPRDALVVAIEGEIDDGRKKASLDPNLASLIEAIPMSVRDRAVVLLTANSLRKSGVRLVEYGHVEQAIRDVVAQLGDQPLFAFAERCRHLVVSYQEAALLHVVTPKSFNRSTTGPVTGSIHICPNWDKLAHSDNKRYGAMPGKLWIVLSAIVTQVHKRMHTELERRTRSALWDLAPALRLGIATFNYYASDGFRTPDPILLG